MILAHGGMPRLSLVLLTVVGGALAAGGANTFNMYIDRDIDRLMERTQGRPLVTGAITPRSALVFGVALEAVAFVLFYLFVNWLSAVLALGACLYVFFTALVKEDSSKYRHRRCRRCRPGTNRLGRCNWVTKPESDYFVCDRFFLDPAALGH